MKLVRFALDNPYTIIVGVLAVVVLGVTCLVRMPVDILPQFQTPAVQIVTFYPGMPAEVMEKDITTRLERWTGQSAGIARQESRSMIGVSIVKDFFNEGIDPASAIAQVSSYAMSDLFYLPPGTIPPMIMPFDPTATVPLALITVSSSQFDETKLYDVAYFDLRNRLQGISGVIAPAVYGGKLRRILAYVDRDKLEARGLSPMDVVQTLRSFSTLIPTGTAKLGDVDYQVITNGMPAHVDEMNAFPIRIEDGTPVLIRDVGEVKDSHQIQSNIVRISAPPDMTGKRQVYIPIYRQPGANTIAVVDGIRGALASILERLPKGINLDVVMDQSIYVRRAIRSLAEEGGLGAGLAALMILLFIGDLRSTLMTAAAIPLSILAAFVGLYFTGNSIDAMTLGGLALAVGRLVDDAIVVLENTDRHLAQGTPLATAALAAAAEVSMPVLAATVTTIVVFFPVVFLTGIGRFLFTPLALAVAFSIGASYLVAMTVVPVYCARFLGRRTGGDDHEGADALHRLLAGVGRRFDRVRDGYGHWLAWSMTRRGPVLAGVGTAFIVSLALARFVGTDLFPEVDAGQFSVRVRAASGTRIERTEDLVARIEEAIKETIPASDLTMLIANAGVLLDWPAAYTPNAGPQDAFIDVQLSASRRRSSQAYADLLRRTLPAHFPGVAFSFHAGGIVTAALNGGLPSPIDVQVSGNKLDVAAEIAERIRAAVATVPAAVDVRVQQRLDYPAIKVDVDRTKAAYLGLTPTQVVKNVVTSLNSSINFDPAFWIDQSNGNHYFLGAQYSEEAIQSLATLENIPLTGPGATGLGPVPVRGLSDGAAPKEARQALLKSVASFEKATAPTEVNHLNIGRVIDLYANVVGRDVGGVASDVEAKLAPIRAALPAGYAVTVRGEVQSMRESFADLGFGFVLAAALVYLIMVAQFRSFLDPFVVMFAVPLGLIGVVAILLLTGSTLNVQSFMGVIFMVGIAVSNSVLLVEFANRLRASGRPVADAAIEAARIRFRPIVMTSLAGVLGLLPMAIGLGHGSEANVPLARAVVGGLGVSTVLTLFVVPILYRMLKERSGPAPASAGTERS
ncbi:MAG: efflux RND transporter permease subunit [Deltaproteobacteria bacterium]|nr:efflux RND transporter permease subunit [Deltaproteobacteria bacterium]